MNLDLTNNPADILGQAGIVRLAYEGGDMQALLETLVDRVQSDPDDAAALLDLSTLMLVTVQPDQGLALQAEALARRRLYRRTHGRGDRLTVLAVVAPGDFMTNTPIDLLLEGSDVTLWLCYVDAQTQSLAGVPEHDVAFLAIGESEDNLPILERAAQLLADWPRPVVNAAPVSITGLARDALSHRLEGESSLYIPRTTRADREALRALADGRATLDSLLPGEAWPLIVRPVGTHAGKGLEKIDGPRALAVYLDAHPDEQLYLAPFVDYSGADGLYRKQRVAFIDGRAYPSHFAVSEHWMVHYLSADMTERAERRAEEERWMTGFDNGFALRHAQAFTALSHRLGLDYFGIDCAETSDGRLLIFEADVAMIVHALDPAGIFPYKKPAMRKLFEAFVEALARRAARP
uniref:ATP-grasp domain-containing protein n=1 Tax=uncultured Caulobacter sp. TaxID=158749 RepID=UPI0025FF3F33|nr:hypothetical protein [uncultured Caulobacter sp.]